MAGHTGQSINLGRIESLCPGGELLPTRGGGGIVVARRSVYAQNYCSAGIV